MGSYTKLLRDSNKFSSDNNTVYSTLENINTIYSTVEDSNTVYTTVEDGNNVSTTVEEYYL